MRKFRKLFGWTLALGLIAVTAIPAFADTYSYFIPITVTSTSGDVQTGIPILVDMGNQGMVDLGYMDSDGLNTRMKETGEARDYSIVSDKLGFLVPSIAAYQEKQFKYYTDYSPDISNYGIVVGPSGSVGVTDADNLEPSDNFTIEQYGWVNLDAIGSQDTYLDFTRGNSDWVSIPDHADFTFHNATDEPFSITAWVYLEEATSSTILAKSKAANLEWHFATTGADDLRFVCYKQDGTASVGRDTDPITAYEDGWIHIAGTYDGTEADGGFNIYINGVDADTTNAGAGAYGGMTGTTAKVSMGAETEGTANYMDGGIAQVKVYSVELTPAQVLNDYNGDMKWTDLVAWWRIDEGVGNPSDSSGNGHDSTANLADWVIDTSTLITTQKGILVSKAVAFETYISSLTSITSVIGGDPDVSVTATGVSSDYHEIKTTVQPVLELDGVADYVDLGNFNPVGDTKKQLTVLFWFKGDTGGSRAIARNDRGLNHRCFYVAVAPTTNFFRVGIDKTGSGATTKTYTNEVDYTDGVWRYFAITFNGNLADTSEATRRLRMFLNGERIPEASITFNTDGDVGYICNLDAQVLIGASENNNVAEFFAEGLFAEVRMFGRALSSAEILEHYNGIHSDDTGLEGYWRLDEAAGAIAYDGSGNGRDGTIVNSTWGNEMLKIYVDDTLRDVDDGASVPGNNNDWAFMQNDGMPYSDNITIWVDGDRELWFRPIDIISGTELVDRAGGDNNGTIIYSGRIVDSGTTTQLTDIEMIQVNDYWNDYTLKIVETTDGNAPEGEESTISDFDAGSDNLTFGALTAAVGSGDRYEIWNGQVILWASFPSTVNVKIGALAAYTTPVSTATGVEEPEVVLVPPEPGGMWGGAASVDLPMYVLFNAVATDLGWTAQVLYVLASIIVSIGMGLAVLLMTGSILVGTITVGVGMFTGQAMGILPLWMMVVYFILAATWIYVARNM